MSQEEILAIITARGGSKGIPRKNLAPLDGRPLLAWTLEVALKSPSVTRTLVTTDDEEIARVARQLGADVPFLRPAEFSTDEATSMSVLRHTLEWLSKEERYHPSLFVLLQPTSPFRSIGDVEGAVRLHASSGADAVMSVRPATDHPLWTKRMGADGRLTPYVTGEPRPPRRQELPVAWVPNGAVYVAAPGFVETHGSFDDGSAVGFPMPAERSLDIDTPWDLEIARRIVETRTREGA